MRAGPSWTPGDWSQPRARGLLVTDSRSREKGRQEAERPRRARARGGQQGARLAPWPQGAVAIIMPIKTSKFKM